MNSSTFADGAPAIPAFAGFGGGPLRYLTWGRAAAVFIALLVLTPVLAIVWTGMAPAGEVWAHLWENVLGRAAVNTGILVLGVAAGTLVLGVVLGWLTAMYDFPGRRFFTWALLLPMAVPAFVLAFVFLGFLDYTGPVQTAFRAVFPGWAGAFPNVRSAGGVIVVLTLVLYPYVYLMTRGACLTLGRTVLEASRSLGAGPARTLFRVILPMARPWIAGGLILVVMETLADFGAVSVFNYDTLATAVYKSWFGLFSLTGAAQLSSILVAAALGLLFLEHRFRGRRRFGSPEGAAGVTDRVRLAGWPARLATGLCLAVFLAAFALPAAQLTWWAARDFSASGAAGFIGPAGRTLFLAGAAAVMAVTAALVLAFARRRSGKIVGGITRAAAMGYAVPGTVLAVGLFLPVAFIDQGLAGWTMRIFGWEIGPVLQGSLPVLLWAYLVRFLAGGFNAADGAIQRIPPALDESAALLGAGGWRLFRKVHLPLLRTGLLTGLVLVLVDVMKEMPVTLMLRPFGWDTLAVKIYELTSEGEWERAALPAMVLVLVGLFPVALLAGRREKQER